MVSARMSQGIRRASITPAGVNELKNGSFPRVALRFTRGN